MDESSRPHRIPYQKPYGHRRRWKHVPVFALAFVFGMSLALLAILSGGPISQLIPVAQAHAVLLRSDPAANATLRVSPTRVRLWFDDDLVPATSRLIVDDAAVPVVDTRDIPGRRCKPRGMVGKRPRVPCG